MFRVVTGCSGMTADEAWQQLGSQAWDWLTHLMTATDSRLSPLPIMASLVIVAMLYLVRRPAMSFLSWAFPARIYRTRSFLVDLGMFVLNYFIQGIRIMKTSAIAGLLAVWMQRTFASGDTDTAAPNLLVLTILMLATADFSVYWIHRICHETNLVWPLHSLHHSAEELNPVTSFRHHPAFFVLNGVLQGITIGFVQGIVLILLFDDISVYQIVNTNAAYAIFNLAGSNLRHSHIWLSFGRIVEHVIISPAQHQIHHSIDPRHRNKNYGEVLAIWDWMFGSLYIPQQVEVLAYGLSDDEGNRVEQPHPTFWKALVVPIQDFWRAVLQLGGKGRA